MLLCGKFLPVFYPRILEFQDFAREVHTSEYLLAMDPLFPQLLRGEANLLRNARCALIPRILCSSQKSTWISAAQNPGIRNPHASHDSLSQQILFHHFSLAFCWADCQPQCA